MTTPLLIAMLVLGVGAPDTLRLETAYESARRNFPPMRQTELYADITELRIENINAQRLPQLSTSAQAIYQSEVPELPLQISGATTPEVSKDQYKAALDVEQLVYDGGLTAARRALERATGALAAEEIEVALHERLDRITEAYFAALLQDAAAATLASHREDLMARRRAVRAQIDEGLLSANEADVLTVEILKIEQLIDDAHAKRGAALSALEVLSGMTIEDEISLVAPEVTSRADPASTGRPEYRIFALQKERLERQQHLAAVQNRPKISGFGTAAYGRPPGMNIFENELSPYYSIGIQVRWPIWQWGTSRREREAAALQQEVVETQKQAFTEGIRAAAIQARQKIDRLRAAVERDREIIQLREQIAARAADQLENGTISATEYLLEQQAAQQARLAQDRHRIELGLAEVRYQGILGQYDEIR